MQAVAAALAAVVGGAVVGTVVGGTVVGGTVVGGTVVMDGVVVRVVGVVLSEGLVPGSAVVIVPGVGNRVTGGRSPVLAGCASRLDAHDARSNATLPNATSAARRCIVPTLPA